MYSVGQTFLYSENGICRLEEVVSKTIKDQEKKYYVLKPLFQSGSTIFMPTDNPTLLEKLKEPLNLSDIKQFPIYATEKTEWIQDDNLRNDACCSAILTCNRKELIKLLKSVHEHKLELMEVGKHLRSNDEKFMKKAKKMLSEEVSLVMQIPLENALAFIFGQE